MSHLIQTFLTWPLTLTLTLLIILQNHFPFNFIFTLTQHLSLFDFLIKNFIVNFNSKFHSQIIYLHFIHIFNLILAQNPDFNGQNLIFNLNYYPNLENFENFENFNQNLKSQVVSV